MNYRIFYLFLFLILVLSMTSFSQRHKMGLLFSEEKYAKVELADFESFGFVGELPKKKSLKPFAPFAKNQGTEGTCVGWSSSYAALTIEYAQLFGLKDRQLISATAFCPYFTYNQIKFSFDTYCSYGAFIADAMQLFQDKGGKRFFTPKYACGVEPAQKEISNGAAFKVNGFYKLFDFSTLVSDLEEQKVKPMKQALADNHPIVIAMTLPSSFDYLYTDRWEPSAYEMENSNSFDLYRHAMCVVGYDDEKYGGAFEIMNSWGADWGNEGFIWVSYEQFATFVYEAYYMELKEHKIAETGCVLGDCISGFGRYLWSDGATYEGNFSNGNFNGFGIYQWADGELFAGEWSGGKQHGEGTTFYADGSSHEGNWDNGEYQDNYRTDNSDNETESDETYKIEDMDIMDVIEVFADNEDAEIAGCLSGDCENGFGYYIYDDGNEYEGYFQNGLRNGYGVYFWESGATYSGIWYNGLKHGIAKYEWTDGIVFLGEYEYGFREGFGTFYYPGGSVQAGTFTDGEFNTIDNEEGFGFADNSKNEIFKRQTGTISVNSGMWNYSGKKPKARPVSNVEMK